MKKLAKDKRLLNDMLRKSLQLGHSIYINKNDKEEEETYLGEEAEQILSPLPTFH